MSLSRRELLSRAAAVAAAGGAGPLLGGCGRDDRPRLEVAVVWTGDELANFRRAVADCPYARVSVAAVGDDIDSLLQSRWQAGTPPDVAILPRPGLLREYANRGWLLPLTGLREPKTRSTIWHDLVRRDPDDQFGYGAWYKVSHKSVVWYCVEDLAAAEVELPPRTLEEFAEAARAVAASGRAAFALGGADGWVLTDWFENVLLAQAGVQVYQRLARQATAWAEETKSTGAVTRALTWLINLWGTPGILLGGAQGALLTQFGDSVTRGFARCPASGRRAGAAMLVEGDFVWPVLNRFREQRLEGIRCFPFPAAADDARTGGVVAGGDVAVVFNRPRSRGASGDAHASTDPRVRAAMNFVAWLTEGAGSPGGPSGAASSPCAPASGMPGTMASRTNGSPPS